MYSVLEALAWESILELSAGTDAFAANKHVSELLDAPVARSPIGLLVLVAHTMADHTVRCRLNLRQSGRRQHHIGSNWSSVDAWISDQVGPLEGVEISAKLSHTIVAGKPIVALLGILIASAITVGAISISLNLGEVLRQVLVILRNLNMLELWGTWYTGTELSLTLFALIKMRLLEHGLTMSRTELADWNEISDLSLNNGTLNLWLRVRDFHWLLNWGWVESSLGILTPACRHGLPLKWIRLWLNFISHCCHTRVAHACL